MTCEVTAISQSKKLRVELLQGRRGHDTHALPINPVFFYHCPPYVILLQSCSSHSGHCLNKMQRVFTRLSRTERKKYQKHHVDLPQFQVPRCISEKLRNSSCKPHLISYSICHFSATPLLRLSSCSLMSVFLCRCPSWIQPSCPYILNARTQ